MILHFEIYMTSSENKELLVGAYARRGDDDDGVAQHGGHTPNNGLTEICSLGLHIDYFMESARVRYLRTSCWRIRKRTSERSERVSFLIQKQRVICLFYTY